MMYLKIKLKMAMTALNCSEDLASCGYQTARTMMSRRMLTTSIANAKTTVVRQERDKVKSFAIVHLLLVDEIILTWTDVALAVQCP